jgi:cytochrome b6-f complex iron-sulfur subunit
VAQNPPEKGPTSRRFAEEEARLVQQAEAMGLEVGGRRRFIEVLLGTGFLASLASFLYPITRYLVPPPLPDLGGQEVVAARVGELKLNSAKIFRFGTRPGLLVMTSAGDYRAFSATCTHLDCTVQYRNDQHDIWCACHNGIFDLNGRNVSGPPPRPLTAFDVHVVGEDIVVSRRQED